MNGSFSFATDQPVQYGCSTCQTKLNHLCPDICRQMLTYVMIVNVCLTYVAKCVDFPAHLSMTCSSMLDLCGHIYMRHMFHICQPYRQQMSTRLKMSRAGWQGLLPVRAGPLAALSALCIVPVSGTLVQNSGKIAWNVFCFFPSLAGHGNPGWAKEADAGARHGPLVGRRCRRPARGGGRQVNSKCFLHVTSKVIHQIALSNSVYIVS